MGIKERILKPRGEFWLYENGKLIRHTNNLVVDTGIAFILDRLIDASAETINWWAIGQGTTVPAAGDIDLESESVTGRIAIITRSRASNIITITGQAGSSTYNEVWSEMGLFFNSTGSSKIFSRLVFDPYSKVVGTTIDWIWKISL